MVKVISELKPMERVLLTLRGEETDRVPVCTITVGCTRLITGISFPEFSTNAELAAQSLILTNQLVGDDIIFSFIDLSVEAADFGQEVLYPLNTTAHPNYDNPLIKAPDDYEGLKVFDPLSSPRMSNYLRMTRLLVEKVGNELPVVGFVYGPLGILSMLRGSEDLYLDILEYPDKVYYALDVITEVLERYVSAQCDIGVSGVCIDTLPAALSGVSPSMWERLEGEYVKRLGEIIRKAGCLVVNHGCGHAPYFREVKKWLNPDIISFAEFPMECADHVSLKEIYGKDTTLMGYIPTELLYTRGPSEVIEECWKQIEQLGKGGRYVLSPGCEYPPNKDILNARAMVVASELYASRKR